MIDFRIEDRKYTIPTIKMCDYYKIKTHLILDDMEGKYQILHELTGCPMDDLIRVPYNELKELFALLEVMLEKSLVKDNTVVNKIKFKDVDYGLVDFDRMTLGEFADLDVIVNDPNADNRLHEVLAILYRPIVKQRLFSFDVAEYETIEYKERCKLFLDLPLKYAKSATAFFLSFELASSGATEIFLNQTPKENRKTMKKILKVLEETGTPQLPILQIVIRLRLAQLRNWVSGKLLTFLPGVTMKTKKLKAKVQEMFVKYKTVR
jgi:hypothetical protein